MQPPPRTGPPGASGPPPSGPNMFRRTRPQKHTAAATATMPPAAQPMTDPFAFGRAPPPTAAGGLPTIPNSNPPPMQIPPNTMYSQPGSGLPPQPIAMEEVPAAPPGLPPSSLPGVPLFNPHSTASAGVFPAPGPTGYASSHTEQGYFNSREQTPSMPTESPPMAVAPAPRQTPFNQEFQGQPAPLTVPFQPLPPTSSPSQWAPDHGSRPPSVQNYFQPTSDPQPFNIPPQTQMYPSHSPSPHHNTSAPPTQPGHLQNQAPVPPQNPVNSSSAQWPDPNGPQQHNSHFQTQNYFSQSSAPQDSWFNQPPQDSGYHQMGTGLGHPQLLPDSAGSQPVSNTGPAPSSAPAPVPYSQESGTLSMFFKDNDVENEEILAGERNKAVNGIAGSFQHHSSPQAHGGHGDVSLDYQGASVQDHSHLPYMNDGNHPPQGNTQKPPESQFDHVENLECVPNQEVLPSETHGSPVAAAPHGVDQFETGPNLETPDSIPRPMRSASVSSNYSNMSHGSGTSSRRHQGVVGTFIQQESPRLTDDVSLSAATGGYFEQIDSSPAGDMGVQQSSLEQMWPPTPSPPKPTGIFQASANSSFEPVRSHSVGVRPAEIDRAKMVAEGGADCTPGNMEQPPDNMENIYGPGHPLPAGAGGGVPHVTHPVVHSHSRPSSRAFGASRPCESPATTLWAQNDPTSLAANILLAPAAPTVLAPLREPSADVIQPPEDCPLDLQASQRIQQTSQQHSENLENPPKVTKDAQQGVRVEGNASVQTPAPTSAPQVPPALSQAAATTQQPPSESPKTSDSQAAQQEQKDTPPVPVSGAQPSHGQYAAPVQGPAAGSAAPPPPPATAYPPGPRGPVPPGPGASQPAPAEPPRPPSSAGSHQSYGPPPPPGPGQIYGGYYGNYGEYPDSRAPYPPGPYPPPPGDPRAQPYYQDGSYRGRGDQWYGRYEGQAPGYRDPNYQYHESQPERPSSRASQYSDRPSSRQGYPEDYHRANRSAYSEYYADYPKHYDYRGYNYGPYDPRYRAYYDQPYWSNYDDTYRARDSYYNQSMYPARKDGYEDQWRYYPGYDTSFDDEYRRRGEMYGDDFDRRSVHSEQSAHSAHSSHSHHSRRSSFSSRSQQSQVYRSQPDLVSAVYDTTSSTLAVDYSYVQYPNQTDASQNYSSQYLYPSEYPTETTWIAPEQPPPRPATPEKFTIPHRCARFGPGGHLVQVLPNLPSAGQPALVDIHNIETMLQDTADQAELRSFPGPLVKEETHKVDVIKFSQNKAVECSRDNNLLDRDSARLLWDFIMLLCRQNGTVVGTDIADLLLKEHRSVWLPGKSPNEANLIDFNNEPLARAEEEPGAGPLSLLSDTFMTVPENVGKETERFRELLLFGRKKDALEAAMKGGLWGHALLLASKMDNRTHARVMTRFANSLPINDPLQTVYQLMSGRMPASATCCGEEKWGDWRPHLAMVLSNLTHTLDLDTRTITTMGDTLVSKGLNDAAHFCYLMAQVGLGVFTKKSTKMVLIGSNHSLPFYQFATNEAIQRTEAYEYAQSLGSQPCSLPNFQVYKLIYACRLAEAGLSAQAFHYCEVISRTVLMQPAYYSPVFISQIIQMSEKLRFFDPQLKEKPEQELFIEPEWLIHLRQLDGQLKTGVITYSADRETPTQFDCSSPSSDLDEPSPPEPYSMPLETNGPAPDNPLMSSLLPGSQPQGVQLMPPAPTSILQDGMAPPQLLPPSDGPQFYPVHPSGPPGQIPISGYPPQDPGFAPPPFQPQPEQLEMYPGAHQQPCPPPQMGHMSPHMPPQMPHSPVQMNHPPPQMPPHMPPSPGHMPPVEQRALPEMPAGQPISSSPSRGSLTPQKDFYDQMAQMGPGRSRAASQSSMYMPSGRRSRTTSESSSHSIGRERSNSAVKQVSPPPPSIPEQPRKEEAKKVKKDSPKKGGGGVGWLGWIMRGRKNEAHLPDDKNKSIVWDEKKQRWVDLNEPEEESKPPPPPPSGFPKMAPMPGPGGPPAPPTSGPSVNMFSRKAGTKSRYVDVLNPSRTAKPGGMAPAPADIFAPLAPMPMPANLFVPSSAPDDQQPLEGSEGGNREQSSPNASAAPQMFNPTLLPPAPEGPPVPDGSQSGELSRSSSMSSLSREVSQHLNQSHPAPGTAPTGGVTFYNPAQFAQTSAPSGGGLRSGRLGGQRQYPVLK
ncbi:LOW QUALITY PROTEIN: protein transport protein Sec16A [Acanthochromis polyacanthus]|uniref:LOW QUALITY PROTEIN: protein transport protein Sec16A n=1 Tax=Acanthochromis polyacanthus TaxID=80966 RepID=UPI002234E9DD|nr:LOW QUALITY PROTEIN: protein transport protein Sec16A [Acanthochromis polyacanthus]